MKSLQNNMGRLLRTFGLSGCICLICGCGAAPKEAELAHAEGIVKINGVPAANILVQFLPVVGNDDPGPTSSGISDDEGEFHLETADGKPGAVVGPCKVLFIDMTEERVPQGVTPKPPRIPSNTAVVGPHTRQVEVQQENSPFEFDITN